MSMDLPLLFIGDFNYIVNAKDKKGSKSFMLDCNIWE